MQVLPKIKIWYILKYEGLKYGHFYKGHITNVCQLDAYAAAGSIQSCTSMRLGCQVPVDWRWFINFPHY